MEISRDIRRTYLHNLVGRFPSLVWNGLCFRGFTASALLATEIG